MFMPKGWCAAMPSRLTVTLVFLACISSSHLSYGQQIIGDVPVSWIGHKGYPSQCDQEGRFLYRPDYRPEKDDHQSVVRVNQDGSTSLFQIPDEKDRVSVFASADDGLVVVAAPNAQPSRVFHMYHFDKKGKVVTQHTVSLNFRPAAVAVTSGKTVVVGYLRDHGSKRKDLKPAGAVLGVDDSVSQLFELPPTAEGGNWIAGFMAGGDGVAYEILKAWGKPTYAVATITESGRVNVNVLPVPPDDKARHHFGWLLGPGVVVENYSIFGELPDVIHFDEYDIASSKKLRTKITPPPAFPNGLPAVSCYLEDEIVALVPKGDGDQQSMHRVALKLAASTGHN